MDEDQPTNRRSLIEIQAILTILAQQAEASKENETDRLNQAEAGSESSDVQASNTDQITKSNPGEADAPRGSL